MRDLSPWLRGLAAVTLLSLAVPACDSTPPKPAVSVEDVPSPKDSPVAYKTLKDEINNGSVEYHLLVADGTRHDDVDLLLKFLYRHLMTRNDDPPAGISAFVYTTVAAYQTPPRAPVGSVVKRPSDLGPAFENKVPLEFWQEIDQALYPPPAPHRDKGWKLAMKIERNDPGKTVTLTVPFTEPGEDKWAETVSFNQAMQSFTDLAQALFKNVAELREMTFVGLAKEKEVVRIVLSRADFNTIKLSEIDERIGQHHGRIFLSLQQGPHANKSPEKANVAASKENAALTAKEYKAMLTALKGKATVSPTLK